MNHGLVIGDVWDTPRSLTQFWADWRRERDPGYTTQREGFRLKPSFMLVSGFAEGMTMGPTVILEDNARSLVVGKHTHGYVGGGSSYGGSYYERLPLPKTLHLLVRTIPHKAATVGIAGDDPLVYPLGLMRVFCPSHVRCQRHPFSTKAAGWEVFVTEEEAVKDFDEQKRYSDYFGLVHFRLSAREIWDFVLSIPCDCSDPAH